jgi:hypothetical protein
MSNHPSTETSPNLLENTQEHELNLPDNVNTPIVDNNIINNMNNMNSNHRYSTPPRRPNQSSPPSIKEERMNARKNYIILKRCRTPSPTELNYNLTKHFD